MSVKFFGQFLLERGAVTGSQLAAAVRLQEATNVKLGALAVELGLLRPDQAEHINLLQRKEDTRFGDLAVREGLLSAEQVTSLLKEQRSRRIYLGEAVVRCGTLDRPTLEAELEAFQAYQRREAPAQELDALLVGRPNQELLRKSLDLCLKLLVRVAHMRVKPGLPHGDASFVQPRTLLYQEFTGAFDGVLGLNLGRRELLRIATKMIGEEWSTVDETALDGAGEFLNILSGNLCGRLSSENLVCGIRPPTVVAPGTASYPGWLGEQRRQQVTFAPIVTPDGAFELILVARSG